VHPIDLASFWPGYDAVACRSSANNSLLIELEPQAGSVPRCGRCGQLSPLIHERRIRLVRDRDLFDQRVLLQLPVRRVDCLSCGRVTERIDWLEPASRLTRRLRVWLESLLRLLPISHVSQLTGLHWHTLKTLDKRRLQAEVGTFDSSGVRRLVMDEFALHKGHRYATVIMDAERTRVLWVGHGNSREAIRPFFELLGEHCQQIEAVAMDMNTAPWDTTIMQRWNIHTPLVVTGDHRFQTPPIILHQPVDRSYSVRTPLFLSQHSPITTNRKNQRLDDS